MYPLQFPDLRKTVSCLKPNVLITYTVHMITKALQM